MPDLSRRGLLAGMTGLLAGCAEIRMPDIASIYSPVASIQGPERLRVIGIPGTLGSRLVDIATGAEIWGGQDDLSVDPATPEGLRALALPIGDGTRPNRELEDTIRAPGALLVARARILGIPVEVEVYAGLARFTRLAGWVAYEDPVPKLGAEQSFLPPVPPPEANLFTFGYDWRRDLIDSVKKLDQLVQRRTEQVALMSGQLPGAEPVRFNLVAHSMGCLIARYYLMYGAQDLPADGGLPELTWAGAQHFNKAVMIAPPNAGSITAFENLVNGKTLGPLLPFFRPALVGAHFSTYALMPRNRHLRLRWKDTGAPVPDLYDPALWDRMGWGLASPAEAEALAILMPDVADAAERRRRALLFQAEALARAAHFHRALDREVEALPPGLDLHLVVGGSYRTPAGASVDPATGAVEIDRFEEGDGVVLRASSLLDERQGGDYSIGLRSPLRYTSTLFLPEEHTALTQSAVFGDNLLFWLTEGRRVEASLRDAGPVAAPPLRDSRPEKASDR